MDECRHDLPAPGEGEFGHDDVVMDLATAVDAVRRGDLEFLAVVLANMNREAGLVAAIKLLSVVA